MRVLSVVGNRPQFIKSAPVSAALRAGGIDEVVLHTGQHYDDELSAVFFEELGLPEPTYRLEAGSGSHAEHLARMLPGIEEVVLSTRPAWTLVFGDTNSTLAGALAAAKAGSPVAHVESGLRSFDRTMPEEVNRAVVDQLSRLLLCPSERAVDNLRTEGITEGVHLVGDVMLDASRLLTPLAAERSQKLGELGVSPGGYLLLTLHRESNVKAEPLVRVARALAGLDEAVLFPAHPRTRAALERTRTPLPDNVRLLLPLGYLDFSALVTGARLVLTDSGGLQKEAYWQKVPCVTLREETEWPETVEAGWNQLAGTDPDQITTAVACAATRDVHPALYGNGRAAEEIVRLLATIDPA
ncbi:MAG: UDP-N-acetylglucosamine 2-epimerase (non-hydrolyzing) [Actinomycetia bacterium]|nr:UDP-N-acetylglucosamine 2-epimerase (non-hydrolyzing) [Actinomycetes bacterium]